MHNFRADCCYSGAWVEISGATPRISCLSSVFNMAESCVPLPDSTCGHDYDFIDAIPESLLCPVCFLPFRDPHLVSCCGAKYCDMLRAMYRSGQGSWLAMPSLY